MHSTYLYRIPKPLYGASLLRYVWIRDIRCAFDAIYSRREDVGAKKGKNQADVRLLYLGPTLSADLHIAGLATWTIQLRVVFPLVWLYSRRW